MITQEPISLQKDSIIHYDNPLNLTTFDGYVRMSKIRII